MINEICAGTVFIEDGAFAPEMVEFAPERFAAGWSAVVRPASAELCHRLDRAGWTFFYRAGHIHADGFGFSGESRIRRALGKVVKFVERENCNCLEITDVRQRSFLGIPFVSLAARSRRIEKSRSFEQIWAMSIAV